MDNKEYTLRYLPLFKSDLIDCANYISNKLQNPIAAEKLISDIETAILERLEYPLSFQPYHSKKNRDTTYYRINVRNFSVFYVVIDDVMEVRRLIYNRRDIADII